MAFLAALVFGLVHPLGLAAHHDGVTCHEHADGHFDPGGEHRSHDHSCAFCHLAETLAHTTPPASAVHWQPQPLQLAVLPGSSVPLAPQAASTPFSARAPPRV